jgi:hypothetical protein
MAYFFAGCLLLVLLILAARGFSGADPRRLATAARKAGGAAALGAAGFLILRGALPVAIPLAVFGLSLLRRGGGFGAGPFGGSPTPGQTSDVRTDKLDMTLDHDSGQMDGTCLTGRFSGRALSSLNDAEVMEVLHIFRAEGAQEAALVEAYLDWRLPGWRDREDEARAKSGGPGRGRGARGGMSAEEAYAVLGIGPGASDEDIRQAHRRLMMKMHPDQGGSTYLAARINEAKEVLLGRG